MNKILVIGDDLRSFLAIARSLGRKGYEVHAAPFDFSSPALSSRYIRAIHRLPRYAMAPAAWLTAMQELIATHQYALIIPCGDHHLLPLVAHRDTLDARIAVPNDAALDVFFDKVKTRDVAVACGVPIAQGGPVSDALIDQIGLPFALKPRQSVMLDSIARRGEVKIIRTAAERAAWVPQAASAEGYFVEAFFAGDGVGVSVLAEHGRIVLAFQHRRLAETSEAGGSSSRVSEALNPDMLRAATAMCAAVAYHGVAMFEFRHNPQTRAFVLLEVNARFWGSLPLAVASGVDFPAALAEMLIQGAASATTGYSQGVKRHHLTAEYYRVLQHSESAGGRLGRIAKLGQGLPRLAWEIIQHPDHFDSYAKDDPAPWTSEKERVMKGFRQAITNRLPVNAEALKRASLAQLRRCLEPQGIPPHIMFVCLGNICRSPFAERLLAQELGNRALVTSAGTLMLPGRMSPPDALATAPAFGVALDDHRSRCVDMEAADNADVIIIFDDRNAHALAELGVDSAKIIRLGDLIGLRAVEDPYARGRAAFETCYTQIRDATAIVAREVLAR